MQNTQQFEAAALDVNTLARAAYEANFKLLQALKALQQQSSGTDAVTLQVAIDEAAKACYANDSAWCTTATLVSMIQEAA